MKSPISAVLVLALAGAPLFAAAQPAARSRILTMSGHGEAKAVPDMVEVNAGVTTSAATAAAATAANSSRMKAVFAAIEKLGVPQRNIQTRNFSVSPQYARGDGNTAPRLTGYQVNNELSVRLEDAGKLGEALDALVTAGANQVNGVSFSIKEPAPLLADARAKAVADAQAKAQTYAKAAGVTLGPIQAISENGISVPRPVYRMAVSLAAPAPPPVAAGEESVSADVSIAWEIQ